MKKTYINPEIVIVKIATQQMLAGSETKGFTSGTKDAAEADGRAFNFFDDED